MTAFDRLNEEATSQPDAALWQALQPLKSAIAFLQTGAHPDDETSGLLALLGRSFGLRISIACATRGEGGQNALGPERGALLGAIRTAEMEAAAHMLGASLSWLSTDDNDPITDFRFSKSGDETLARWGHAYTLRRMVEIIRAERPDIVCTTFLDVPGQHGHHRAMTRIAREAFDLAADSAFITVGLAPWAPAKFYLPAWSGAGSAYDDEQPPPPATTLLDTGLIEPFSGVPYERIGEWSRAFHATQGMGRWIDAGSRPRPLHLQASRVSEACKPEPDITAGLKRRLSDFVSEAGAAGPHLVIVDQAIDQAHAAFPDREVINHALSRALMALRQAQATRPKSVAAALDLRLERKSNELSCAVSLARGKLATEQPCRHLPTEPLPTAQVSVSLTPDAIIISQAAHARSRTISIEAVSTVASELSGTIGLGPAAALHADAPQPFIAPASLSFEVAIDPAAFEGRLQVPVLLDGEPARRCMTATYPHIGRVTCRVRANLALVSVDVQIAPGTRIAYVGGGNDRVDHWLACLGADVRTVPPGQLDAFDLASVSTVLVGIFAFGMRPDLVAATQRLHAFVRAGGHLVTLYHRSVDNWIPDSTPLAPIEIGSPSLRYRVTDETCAVTHLVPDHPLLTGPNQIGPTDWAGWVKERGLYFARTWDPRYQALLRMADPDEPPQDGCLLSGQFGLGRHTHVALALHSELDALTPGAIRLIANMVQPTKS